MKHINNKQNKNRTILINNIMLNNILIFQYECKHLFFYQVDVLHILCLRTGLTKLPPPQPLYRSGRLYKYDRLPAMLFSMQSLYLQICLPCSLNTPPPPTLLLSISQICPKRQQSGFTSVP